jgi:hypothetical protein
VEQADAFSGDYAFDTERRKRSNAQNAVTGAAIESSSCFLPSFEVEE